MRNIVFVFFVSVGERTMESESVGVTICRVTTIAVIVTIIILVFLSLAITIAMLIASRFLVCASRTT